MVVASTVGNVPVERRSDWGIAGCAVGASREGGNNATAIVFFRVGVEWRVGGNCSRSTELRPEVRQLCGSGLPGNDRSPGREFGSGGVHRRNGSQLCRVGPVRLQRTSRVGGGRFRGGCRRAVNLVRRGLGRPDGVAPGSGHQERPGCEYDGPCGVAGGRIRVAGVPGHQGPRIRRHDHRLGGGHECCLRLCSVPDQLQRGDRRIQLRREYGRWDRVVPLGRRRRHADHHHGRPEFDEVHGFRRQPGQGCELLRGEFREELAGCDARHQRVQAPGTGRRGRRWLRGLQPGGQGRDLHGRHFPGG